jgi:hypothetical protein
VQYRAICGPYKRDWKIQVKRRWFWRTIHSQFMDESEAQDMVDRLAANGGAWETIYPSSEHAKGVE